MFINYFEIENWEVERIKAKLLPVEEEEVRNGAHTTAAQAAGLSYNEYVSQTYGLLPWQMPGGRSQYVRGQDQYFKMYYFVVQDEGKKFVVQDEGKKIYLPSELSSRQPTIIELPEQLGLGHTNAFFWRTAIEIAPGRNVIKTLDERIIILSPDGPAKFTVSYP